MGSHPGQPGGAAAPSANATAIAQAFHVVLKNLAIYPPTHPRVMASADAFLATLQQHSSNAARTVLQATGEQVKVDGALAAEALRLPERFRDAGLRGVSFSPDCTHEDLLTFAAALNRARGRANGDFASHWPGKNPRLEPLPLVFAGVHARDEAPTDWTHDGSAGGVPTGAATAGPRGGVHDIVGRLATSDAVQARLRAIEVQACDPGETEEREIDLLAEIAHLLPADVSGDPDEVAAAVTEVLARVEQSLGDLVHKNAQVAGGGLLRTALEVARKYFQTAAPAQVTKRELPSGRPEDARIVADLRLLLAEIETLPDAHGLCLPRAEDLGENSSTVALRMCGIVLHALANSENPAVAAAALSRLQATVPRILGDLLRLYLGSEGPVTATAAGSIRILEALIAAGHLELVRENRYVDAGFLARGFPETLPLAVQVWGGDATGRRTLREALGTLDVVLQMGGAAAAARSGVLHQPAVVAALVASGGEAAHQLLQQALAHAADEERQMLFECARKLSLPAAEATALRLAGHEANLPPEYLALVYGAAVRRDFTGPVRAASAALLCKLARNGDGRLGSADRLHAIEALQLVPTGEARLLLRQLASEGRFTQLGRESRALRRTARRALAAIEERRPS